MNSKDFLKPQMTPDGNWFTRGLPHSPPFKIPYPVYDCIPPVHLYNTSIKLKPGKIISLNFFLQTKAYRRNRITS